MLIPDDLVASLQLIAYSLGILREYLRIKNRK